jgi:hypothetical protein
VKGRLPPFLNLRAKGCQGRMELATNGLRGRVGDSSSLWSSPLSAFPTWNRCHAHVAFESGDLRHPCALQVSRLLFPKYHKKHDQDLGVWPIWICVPKHRRELDFNADSSQSAFGLPPPSTHVIAGRTRGRSKQDLPTFPYLVSRGLSPPESTMPVR